MAFVGFVATLADGREVGEGDVTWDGVPDVGLSRLALVQFHEQEGAPARREFLGLLDGAPGRRFYFYNETAAHGGGLGFLCAKGIGYLDGETAVEIRHDLLPGPTMQILQGALRRLGGAVNLVQHLECILPVGKLRERLPELTKAIAEMKAIEKASGGKRAAPGSIEAPNSRGGGGAYDLTEAIASTRRIRAEIDFTEMRLKDDLEAEGKVQKGRQVLLDALDEAAEALRATDRDPRTSWRSYPAAQFRLHTKTLRRAA